MPVDIKQLTDFLLEGNEDQAWELVESEAELFDSSHLAFEVLTSAMQFVGKLWEENEITVADEHLATTTCDFVLSRYAYAKKKSKQPSNGKRALFLCIDQEQHYLGLKMISLLFEEYGWETRLLGANLPLEYAVDTAKKWQPSVVGISVALLYHADQLSNYVSELGDLSTPPEILVGGRLASNYDLSKYCSEKTVLVPGLKEIKLWLEEKKGDDSNHG
ncbi:B12-binding domain-containing protein [Alkalihalobacillus sp. R86527]|uniref:cobalamin B12-binding domain-containing protein n=1 Tax=Alkalihalobacillus sp. R86527 TaxID=3093863 RepID=UPI00366D1A38